MNKEQPLVSVIVPVFNGEKYLAEALASIKHQTCPPSEIILIDDGSTDGTAQIARCFGSAVRYAFQPNSGAAAARNRGLVMASGSIVGFLDADDLWPRGKLEFQLAYLNEYPQVEIVLGLVQYLRARGGERGPAQFEEFAVPRVDVNLGSALFRKSVFDRVGYFDDSMHHSEDVDWFLRARECGISMGVNREVGLQYRIHGHNMSRHKDARDRYFVLALKKSLDRRRQLSEAAQDLPGLTGSR